MAKISQISSLERKTTSDCETVPRHCSSSHELQLHKRQPVGEIANSHFVTSILDGLITSLYLNSS